MSSRLLRNQLRSSESFLGVSTKKLKKRNSKPLIPVAVATADLVKAQEESRQATVERNIDILKKTAIRPKQAPAVESVLQGILKAKSGPLAKPRKSHKKNKKH
ncbi:putative mitochondrial protein [Andalucia godoyi]|uniref:Putative mitochondrial protein n=1 Tax=Andalucia godoyi TaxID=505711 RepID=A0A8K0AJA2_ANDGO|nr:putative mitochondrial protein [Andalucia godoyi]|eukprot:ANDGO_06737.mRNA.1 putative mitochondrial protein